MENELFEKPRSEWERLIDEWIFNERDRKILKRRLLDGITHEKIAEEFDMSDRQIRAIVKKSVARLSMKVKI
jgi:DNA-directed RNA polymerase sigma subunit (sigma70/sigma32)